MRRIVALTLILGISLLQVCGCASKYGEQRTSVNYYPACYRPIQDLRDRENSVGKTTAGGALVGALGGALLGLLVSDGKWQGALMGAAAGGVTGTMAGNMYARKQQQADDNIRLASYLQDLDGDISNLDVASAAARTSLQCYDKQFHILLAEIKAKRITRQAAEQRFGEICSGREEAIAILGNAATHGSNLEQQYEEAFASEEQQLRQPAKMAQGTAASRQKARAINTARQRKQALTQKTAALRTERHEAENETARQTQQINEAYAELADIRA